MAPPPPLIEFKINGVFYSPDPDDKASAKPLHIIFSYGPIDVYSSVDLHNLRVNHSNGAQAYSIGQPESPNNMTFWTTACERIRYFLIFGYKFYTDESNLIFFEKTGGLPHVDTEITALRSELARLAYK